MDHFFRVNIKTKKIPIIVTIGIGEERGQILQVELVEGI